MKTKIHPTKSTNHVRLVNPVRIEKAQDLTAVNGEKSKEADHRSVLDSDPRLQIEALEVRSSALTRIAHEGIQCEIGCKADVGILRKKGFKVLLPCEEKEGPVPFEGKVDQVEVSMLPDRDQVKDHNASEGDSNLHRAVANASVIVIATPNLGDQDPAEISGLVVRVSG